MACLRKFKVAECSKTDSKAFHPRRARQRTITPLNAFRHLYMGPDILFLTGGPKSCQSAPRSNAFANLSPFLLSRCLEKMSSVFHSTEINITGTPPPTGNLKPTSQSFHACVEHGQSQPRTQGITFAERRVVPHLPTTFRR